MRLLLTLLMAIALCSAGGQARELACFAGFTADELKADVWNFTNGAKSAGNRITYGAFGLPAEEAFSNNTTRSYKYDCHGWLTEIATTVTDAPFGPAITMGGVSKSFYAEVTGESLGRHPVNEETFVETILYSDGKYPRFDGVASAHVSTLGGRYDYKFDSHDRLIKAEYTPGANNDPEEDFSAEYEYNALAAPAKLTRHGVNNITLSAQGAAVEQFGLLDELNYSWNGALLEIVTAQAHGADFYGRTGYAGSAGGKGATVTWTEAGLLKSDSSRGITDITYNRRGQPLTVTFRNRTTISHSYDCSGLLERVTTFGIGKGGRPVVKSTRAYAGEFVFGNDTLTMTRFAGGYFDSDGNPHYQHPDWQGSITMVTSHEGNVTQHTGYYPYGEPWREPSGQPYLYGGKERMREGSLSEYDFTARRLYSPLALWTTPDPISHHQYNPYGYCAGNPVRYTDPTGCIIEGVRKNDAKLAVEDFRAMFPGDEFAAFRSLIVQDGKKQNRKTLAPISKAALDAAFEGITLNEDQTALVEMVVNTINSKDVHKVEYVNPGKDMSRSSFNVYFSRLNSQQITLEMVLNMPDGCFGFVKAICGEASTLITRKGSLSLILNSPDGFVTNRPATLGHEILGHGRTHRLGYTDLHNQHVLPIQVENLILRNMGISLFRDGTDHAPLKEFIPNYTSLPNIRQ